MGGQTLVPHALGEVVVGQSEVAGRDFVHGVTVGVGVWVVAAASVGGGVGVGAKAGGEGDAVELAGVFARVEGFEVVEGV